MSEALVYIDQSDVRQGKVEEVKSQMQELAAFVKDNMPRLIAYGFYLNDDETRMTVVAIHPDTASLEFHLETGGPAFREFAELITLQSIDVYGRPSEKAIGQLHQKAEMLGENATVDIHDRQAGFSRLEAVTA